MDDEPKRARRRRDLDRMKAKAVRIAKLYRLPASSFVPLANHLAHCSRWCCGNPRRLYGDRTMQERRFEAADA